MSPQHAPPARTTGALGYTTRNFLIVAVLALVGALAAGLIGPNPRLGPAAAGDEALVAEVAAIVGEGRGLTQLAVARLDGDRTDFAGFGDPLPSPDTPFELGSITKVFVGHVLADAVARGDVALDDPLETYLPELAGTPAGGVTLVSLATHTSGLPRLPEGVGGLRSALSPSDPYPAWGVGQLTDAARAAALERPGTEAYSNLGMALLGHALARAAEAPTWAALAEERLFAPLGMTATVTVARPA
ncbi:serine hydrolase, partial [Propioniciclava sp.]|uniref:serine hydrolase domain-containing protein n=1 Tax=Propioniciclava sp. TaxID=2038686 RepID=UPI0026133CAB